MTALTFQYGDSAVSLLGNATAYKVVVKNQLRAGIKTNSFLTVSNSTFIDIDMGAVSGWTEKHVQNNSFTRINLVAGYGNNTAAIRGKMYAAYNSLIWIGSGGFFPLISSVVENNLIKVVYGQRYYLYSRRRLANCCCTK